MNSYILIPEHMDQCYLKGLDSSGRPEYTDNMADAAVVDAFVVRQFWDDHTPATLTEDEMRKIFGEVRKPSTFAELRAAEERVQKRIDRVELPWWRRLLNWFRRS